MSDDKARDILSELDVRGVLGAQLTDKVGRRAWTRPRVSISPRLFRQYRVGDPWDPDAADVSPSIGLGPVSLRLGEKRRQPAPHLKPKAPKVPKKSAPSVPAAPQPRVPDAKPAPAQAKVPAVQSPEALETERLAAEAAEKRRQAEAARSWPRRPVKTGAEALPAKPEAAGPALAPLPVRPEARQAAPAARPEEDAGEARQDNRGRFRMKPAARSASPVVREIAQQADSDPSDASAESSAPPAPRAAPAGPVRGGLDDLFAAAAQAGRMRVPKRPEEAGEE